jgi:hypothetical protein
VPPLIVRPCRAGQWLYKDKALYSKVTFRNFIMGNSLPDSYSLN